MILETYRIEIFNNECRPSAMTVQCFAHLDQDVSPALPYLNSVLGGFEYIMEPPSVSFKVQGKLITVTGRKIAINALKDEAEAKKIVAWMQREINAAWNHRATVTPQFKGMAKVQIIDILKWLPKTNCRQCGAPTCMVFATQVAEGAKNEDNCPPLEDTDKEKLNAYLSQFKLEI